MSKFCGLLTLGLCKYIFIDLVMTADKVRYPLILGSSYKLCNWFINWYINKRFGDQCHYSIIPPSQSQTVHINNIYESWSSIISSILHNVFFIIIQSVIYNPITIPSLRSIHQIHPYWKKRMIDPIVLMIIFLHHC